jgi:hypothetical protein
MGAHKCCDGDLGMCASRVMQSDCCEDSPYPVNCYYSAATIAPLFGVIGPANPQEVRCVPKNKWSRYVRINWGGPGPCREKGVRTEYGCYQPSTVSLGGSGIGIGGKEVGRKGGAPIFE